VCGEGRTLRGEAQAATVGFEQGDAGLAFEQRELLRDRRRTVRQGLGDGRERAPE